MESFAYVLNARSLMVKSEQIRAASGVHGNFLYDMYILPLSSSLKCETNITL